MTNQTLDLSRIESRLKRIYVDDHETAATAQRLIGETLLRFQESCDDPSIDSGTDSLQRWDERDVVLITYGDQVRPDESEDAGEATPLSSLLHFLKSHDLFEKLNTVHFLPCFPYSSDDGFSVIDYREIDPNLGDWEDIAAFRQQGHIMFDFVVNHVSQHSDWFQKYLADEPPYNQFFIEADPNEDLSGVTRPRSLPLLSDFETSRGKRWIWTTFSRDQVDLNYQSPELLAEVIDILLYYVSHGARIIRLDAIAYLWKQLGTSCIHLPETHEVVKLFREVMELVAPHVLILTETNVPHAENVSYFGAAGDASIAGDTRSVGDEAHMVYQFPLPPLLLDAFLNEDAKPLKRWLRELESPPPGATYFNFTASHDGVGVRPLEGQVSDERLWALVEQVRKRGARVGTRRKADGTDSPYELNVSYVDALGPEADELTTEKHAERFLASQAFMMSLQGMPAVYFHSLVGTQNDIEAAESSGIPRRINRRKFTISELNGRLHQPLQQKIFTGMQRLLGIRTTQKAFHPDSEQIYIESNSDQVVCFERRSENQRVLVAANFDNQSHTIELPTPYCDAADLLSPNTSVTTNVILRPSQVVWLEVEN